MSKAKPWPEVANRHRHEAIMKTGEIAKETQEILQLVNEIRTATRSNNTALLLAIAGALEGRGRFVKEAADTVLTILESAPSDPDDIPALAEALLKARSDDE